MICIGMHKEPSTRVSELFYCMLICRVSDVSDCSVRMMLDEVYMCSVASTITF